MVRVLIVEFIERGHGLIAPAERDKTYAEIELIYNVTGTQIDQLPAHFLSIIITMAQKIVTYKPLERPFVVRITVCKPTEDRKRLLGITILQVVVSHKQLVVPVVRILVKGTDVCYRTTAAQ